MPDDRLDQLIRSATSASVAERCRAVIELGRLGPGASAAAPALVALLRAGEDRHLLTVLVTTLGSIGAPCATESLAALLDANPHSKLARRVIVALGKLGAGACAALPALFRARRSTSNIVRVPARAAIESIASACLESGEPSLQSQAIAALTRVRNHKSAELLTAFHKHGATETVRSAARLALLAVRAAT